MLRLLCALGLVAASSASPLAQPHHPAHADAPAAPVAVVAAPLAPATPADVPTVLRPAAHTGPHAAGHHTAHAGATAHGPAAPAPDGLAATLDAYLAVHDALASDRLAGVSADAEALRAAFDRMTATAPAGDPHLWHARSPEVEAVRATAVALATATTLAEARTAFGHLSAPLVALVGVTGLPDGADLAVHRCGMAPGVPDGGVWLQRSGDVRNPYFGSAMSSCGTDAGSPHTHGPAPTLQTDVLTAPAAERACAMSSGERAGGCDGAGGGACCASGCCEDGGRCGQPTAGHGSHAHGDGPCCEATAAGGPSCPHAHAAPDGPGR